MQQQEEPTEQGARSRRMLLSLPPSPFPLHKPTPSPPPSTPALYSLSFCLFPPTLIRTQISALSLSL